MEPQRLFKARLQELPGFPNRSNANYWKAIDSLVQSLCNIKHIIFLNEVISIIKYNFENSSWLKSYGINFRADSNQVLGQNIPCHFKEVLTKLISIFRSLRQLFGQTGVKGFVEFFVAVLQQARSTQVNNIISKKITRIASDKRLNQNPLLKILYLYLVESSKCC